MKRSKKFRWIAWLAVVLPLGSLSAQAQEHDLERHDLTPGAGVLVDAGGGEAIVIESELETLRVAGVLGANGIVQGVEPVIAGVYSKQEQLAWSGQLAPEVSSFRPADGAIPSFSLSDFETLYPESFDEILATDVVSPPGSKVLNTTTGNRRQVLPDGQLQERAFIMSRLRDIPKEPPESWADLKLSEALELESGERGSLDADRIVAITRFRVRMAAGGDVLRYGAAVGWFRPKGAKRQSSDLEAVFFDLHNPGLHQAALVTAPALTLEDLEAAEPPDGLVPQNCCLVENDPVYLPGLAYISEWDHAWGRHKMAANGRVDCECQRSCRQIATFSIFNYECNETGMRWTYTQRMADDLKVDIGSEIDAFTRDRTAKASGGYICGMAPCGTPFCSATVSVNIGLFGSVSFTSSSNISWKRTTNWGLNKAIPCAPCFRTGGGGGGPDLH